MKKLFTLLLVLFASSTWLWAQTATLPSGSGTSGDPYMIDNLDNLYWITQNSTSWDKYFKQTADIDASTTSAWDSSKGFLPIGNSTTKFTGNYDGGGFKITGLYINRPTDDAAGTYIGMFGYTNTNAVIQNLGLTSVSISGYTYVGGLVGYASNGSITNCYTTGTITSSTNSNSVGGLIGSTYNNPVQKCYSSCNVSGQSNVGGLIGNGNTTTVTDCYATGNVTMIGSGNGAGSFAGYCQSSTYNRCFSTGSVTGTGSSVDAFSYPNGATITNCFSNGDANPSLGGSATSATASQLQNPALFSAFDLVNTWRINPTENNGFPTLAWQGTTNYAVQPSGSGTSGVPYLIASLANLYWLHSQSGSSTMYYFKQTADIDASETATWCGGQGWVPIGINNKSWIGNYDGQNYQISGLYLNRTNTYGSYFGLFGLVGNNSNYCYLNNIRLTGVNFTTSGTYLGALIGATTSTAHTVHIKNCNSSGSISGGSYTGGLFGYAFGLLSNFYVEMCYSTCTVSAYNNSSASYLGGLGGYVQNSTNNYQCHINNSYARGAVTSNGSYIGGLIGVITGHASQTNYTTVQYCYSTGSISGSGSYKGGLFGYSESLTLTNDYWDTQTSGLGTSVGGTGLTTAQMKVSSNYTNWNFTDTWYIKTGVNGGYPALGRNLTPTITSFSPAIAVPGTSVTITGTNFNATAASNIVYFGAARASVTAGSETSLTVTVPTGATYAPVTVLDSETAREARSMAYFMPTYSGKGSLASNDFAPKVDFSQNSYTSSMAVADFDGDGKPDMVAGCTDGTLNSQRNTSSSGALGFSSASWANAASSVDAVAVGDFDGDGKPDIVSNYQTGGTFTIKRNNSSVGNISFESALSFSNYSSSGGYGAAVADFDSDGKPDLVIPDGQYYNFRVLRNISNGSSINFTYGTSCTTGAYAYEVVCGDLNGDGKPDMAVTSGNGSNIDVFLNTTTGIGSISFAAKATFAVAGTPWGITMADLDGDGKLDLAVANLTVSTVSVLRNTSSGGSLSFSTKVDLTTNGNPRSISAGDLDGDGKPEIIAGTSNNKLSVFHNASASGTLSFGSKVDYSTIGAVYGVSVADFDGDGKPDLATGNSGYKSVSVLRNSPAQAPPTITSFTPTSAAVGATVTITGTNFNTTPANNIVFFGATKATVSAASATSLTVTVPVGAIYAPITVLNTGISLAAYSTASFMPTYSGKGSLTANDFAPKVNFGTDVGPWKAVMADFDGDGKPDIATANYSGTNSVSVLRNTSTTGTASFATKIDLTAGVSPRGIAVGDIDFDGKPDLVVANTTFGSGASLVSVLRNTSTSGAISFAAKVDLTATNRPSAVAIGDFDGDGKPDIVATNESGNVVSVFLNAGTTGTVNFAAKVDYATGSTPEDVAIADLDGDSKPDIVVVNQSSSTISVLRNICTIGEINFATKTDFSTGSTPYTLVIGDLDNDGKLDVSVANGGSSSVSVLRNTCTSGTISFAAKSDFTTYSSPFGLGIGDLDGDSKPDLVAGSSASNNYASILRNTSTIGSINLAPKNDYFLNGSVFGTTIGDVDGDNKPDLVTTNMSSPYSVSVILNSPAPAPPVVTAFSPAKAAVGESVTISGSGFSSTASNNIVIFGDTKAVVTSASSTSLTVTLPSGASFAPISVLNTENKMTGFSSDRFLPTYAGKGALAAYDFDAKVDFTAGTTSIGVVTGDLDGDGKSDMATGNYSANTISVFRNTGSSGVLSFATKIDYAANTQPRMITMGDLTGDGKPDLAVVHTGSSIVSVYKNVSTVGTLSFEAKIDFTLPVASMGVLIADVDMDGKPDLLVSNQGSNSISIFQNISGASGSIMLAPRVDFATTSSPFGISVGDIDGDGKPDIAVSCSTGISVLKNTGSLGVLSFAAKADFATGSNPQGLKLVDLDGDGKLDLATSCLQSNYISLLRNTSSSGTISFATKIDYASGTNPFDIAVGDFDGDGKPDLVASNQSTSTVSVYRNQSTSGTIAMATKVDLTSASVPQGLAAADMDGDGKVDIVTACQASLVTVIRNNPIIPPPTITSFTPNVAAVGATVNITGTHFSATPTNNIVFFGATQATVTAATATSLTVTVPAGATYAPITVLNTEIKLAAYSAANFMPTYSGTGTILAPDFSPKVDFAVGSNTAMAAMGDVDGDGKPDLAIANGGYVSVFRNTGSTGTVSFADKVDYAISNTCAKGVSIADVDADGKPDMIVTVQCSGTVVSVFKNTSSSSAISFAARKDFATSVNPPYVLINDMDLDGKPDMVLGGTSSDKIAVLPNTSSGTTITFAAEQTFGLGDGTGLYDVKIGDMDGDGLTDVVFLSANKTYFTVLRNTGMPGTINFATPLNVTAIGDLRGLSIGDIDGDGKMDIAATRLGYSTISAFRNTSTIGTISFASRNDFTALSTNVSVMMGDLDGNGKLDLAVTDDTSDNKISLYSNTGSSGSISFATKVDFATGDRPYYGGLIGDVDGDNRPDLITVNASGNSFSVLRNNTALPPTITSFTPTSAASGATVTLTGTDFTGATAVKFGGMSATSFNVVNATTITAVVAAGATGSVTVTTIGGTGTKTGFTFILAPVISLFTPTSSGNGLTVTLTGTDFTGATAVSFGGTAATSFNVVNATTITAVVGTGTSGDVSVTTPGGTGTKSGFTWVAKPVISYALSPISATYGVAITNASPTVTGSVTSYSISPTLPGGLSFNTSSGVISGTPTMISAQTDYTVSATNAGGTGTATVTITIGKKTLTITGVTAANREYDGTLTATLSGGTLNGVIAGDVPNVTISTGTGTFPDKNIGTGKPVTASGFGLTGSASGNYTLSAQPTGITANITQRSLTVTGVTATSKEYDGAVAATFTGGTLNNKVGSETVTLVGLLGNFNNKNVGTTKPIDVTSYSLGGADFANYRIYPLPTGLTANITAKQLTVSGATTTDKVYDRTTTAAVTGGSLVGVVAVDAGTVTLTQAASFADKNAGTAKAITGSCSISGAGASNYTLAQPDLTARNITEKPLTVSATGVNKVYDGNATATVTLSDNRVSGDVLTTTYTAATFPDKAKGTGKTVSVSGISISGTDAANYSFNTTASTSADITVKALTVTATGIDKVYDQNTTATVTLGDNRVSGDVLTTSYTSAVFANKNVAENKSVSVSGISISGTDAGNYTFNTTTTTTATITQKALAVTATGINKVYDGTIAGSVNLSDNRISGDVLTATYTTATFLDKDVANEKAVSVSGIAISGTDAGNYTANTTAGTTANITPKALSVTANNKNKIYDGTPYTDFTVSYTGFENGEDKSVLGGTLSFSGTATTAFNAGTGYVITPGGLTSSNYNINFENGSLEITKSAQTITFAALSGKTFGDAPFDLTATASSGLTVSYASSNTSVATISGNTVTIVGAGTTIITASQAGNGNYNAATSVSQPLTVANQAQSIVFDELEVKTYGDAPFTVSATGGGSGNPVVFSSSDASVATVSGNIITITGAGSCTIYANQAGNGDYGAAPHVARTLTVNKADQTVTFNALTDKTYGDAPFTLGGTASSGLTVTYSSSNTDVATVSGNTVTIRGVGSATITARQAGNTHYNAATSVDQTLTVVKANQTISFAALAGKTYGDAAFDLTASASSGLAVTYSSSNEVVATVSGSTITIVGAGTTTITASQAGNVNYNAATPVEQPLTVGKSSQAISFAALAEKTYGDAPFGLTGTASSGLAVTYSSSNEAVATASGSTITIVGAGTTTITASQSGNANYNAATPVGQPLTVNKASQILTLDPFPTGSQALKDATGPVQVTASSSSGLPVTITLGTGSAATLNASNQLTGIGQSGTIVINVDQAGNANHNAANISATFDLGKSNQSILFPAMSDRIYSPGLTIGMNGSASASSTLPVSYSVISGPATLSGTVLTVTGSGLVLIKASQSGNVSWNAAPEVTRSLTILKSSFVIGNFADLEKTYGDSPFILEASSVSSGLFSYISSNPLVAAVSGNMVTITGAGTAELTVVQAEDANYASVSTTVILKVLQVDQTISFAALLDKTYGDMNFNLTGTASSGLPVSYTSSNPDVAIVSGNVISITGSGLTTITAIQLGNTNYKAATQVAQMLTVGKKSQSITFDALAEKTYGDADFNLTATVGSGLVVTYSSSNEAVATVSGSTVTIVGAGTATITASQSGNENYLAATDVLQTLTVNKADQVLTLSPLPIGSLALKDITFPVQVSASSSSGLPVVITLGAGSAATLNGSIQLENIQQSGSVTIQLNQAGNDNYNAANASYSFDVEKSNQYITFPAITNRVLSAGLTIDLNGVAYASSGLSVGYILVSGPATLSGTVLTISGAGDVVITASQSGNSTWNAATDVTQTISIGKAIPEIINFADLFKTYGDAPFGLNASSESSGAISYRSSDESVVRVLGSQVIIKGAGTAVLTATQTADASYAQVTATSSLFVDKTAQTISFDALPVKTYGDDPFGLSAVSTSGLAMSYTSSDETVATVSGNTVTITGAGTVILTATQAGNSNYKPATDKSRTLTVNKQAQSVTFAALDAKTYGDVPFMLTATGGGSGNPVTFTSSDNDVATVSGNTVTITGAGSCTIYAHQEGNANYSAAPQLGRVLTVEKSDQTISFEALADKTYGDAAFDPAATSTSALGISYISSNTAVATVSGNTLTITGAGTASITAIHTGNSNYNPALPVVQSLTVIKSNQTITFAALAGKTYGDGSFGLTASASSGLTVSYTSSNEGVATVSGHTVTIVGAGTSIITASQPGNGNYNAAVSVTQPLMVANQGQSIVFNSLPGKTYGDAPFTASTTGGGSGNPVIFTSSDASVATVSGNTITIVGAGSCTIYANQAGNGDYSAAVSVGQTLTVQKADQTISFTALPNKIYGDAPFNVSGTGGGSGNPVIFTSSDASVAGCSGINGTTITIVGAGTCIIYASQTGNTNYNAAVSVSHPLTVANQSQSIVFEALPVKTYGDAPFTVSATGGGSGNPVIFTSSDASVATCSGTNGSAITITGAGTCTIYANQAGNGGNSAAAYVGQTLIVEKADQTIVFDPLNTIVVRDADFELIATTSSGLPVTFSSSDESVAICSGTNGATITIIGAGSCTIYANQSGNANYNRAPQVEQKVTVLKYISGDANRDGQIIYPEIAGDTNGDGKITDPEILGDTNGDGKITEPEVAGDVNGDGKIDGGETAGNTGGTGSGIAGDINGDGVITYPEILGDINGDGHINGNEIAGDKNGNGKIDPTETRVVDPEKDHLNVDHLFSPNGDGINDYWKLRDIEKFGRVYVKIYDRWGTLLYESTNYQNDWDGTSKGKSLPEGAYIYFIKTEKDGDRTGVINIVR